jgi:hypothetical protein
MMFSQVSITKRLSENYREMSESSQSDMDVLQSVKPYLRQFPPQWEKEVTMT